MGCCSPPGRNRTALSRDQCNPHENEHAGAFLLTAERFGPVDSAVGTGHSLPVPRLDETQPQMADERSSRFRRLLEAAGCAAAGVLRLGGGAVRDGWRGAVDP